MARWLVLFAVGPLPSGDFSLTAGPTDDPFVACSSAVVASAGSEGIELQLRWGGSLAVEPVDAASGEVLAATVTLREASAEGVHQSGSFFEHLPAGTYEIVAWTQAGSIGVLPRVVVAERRAEELRIELAPGARVRIGALAPELGLQGLDVFAGAKLAPGPASGWIVVPPGPVLVTGWRHRPDGTREIVRRVERALAAGEKWVAELR